MESLHPITVHFPIALLWAAFLVEGLALVWSRPAWHRISLWNLGLGAAGAAAAVFTGRQAMVFGAHLGGRLVYEFGVGGSYGRSGGIEGVTE